MPYLLIIAIGVTLYVLGKELAMWFEDGPF